MVGDTHSSHSARVMLAVSLSQSSSRHLLGPGHSIHPSSPRDTMWLPSAVKARLRHATCVADHGVADRSAGLDFPQLQFRCLYVGGNDIGAVGAEREAGGRL